jgi:AGCS family alanine or glycine:cation symporter
MDAMALELLNTINGNVIWGPYFMIPILILTGIFLTFRLGFVQVRHLRHAFALISGRYDNPHDEGDITHFQALSAALAATIGIGNIAGVATAIHLGGPGAIFWMWVTAFFGMAIKYSSCMLAVRHRKLHEDGSVSGGPMYFIELGLGKSFRWLAVLFATCAAVSSFGTGNMVQSNTVAQGLKAHFGVPPFATGVVLAFFVWLVIVGGIRRIGQVASRLVPAMCTLYIAGAVVILIHYVQDIPGALASILQSAFAPTAATGGFLGCAVMMTLRWGVARGLFSNESGLGTAPIAHAAAKTKEPVREGLVAMVGPFIDTIIICTMTALVIITTGVWSDRFEKRLPSKAVEIRHGAPEAADYASVSELPAFTGTLHAEEGRILNLDKFSLFAHGGLAKDPLVLGPDGNPFTGAIRAEEGSIVSPDIGVRAGVLLTGAELTAEGFKRGLPGTWGNIIVTIGILLFAYSTAISWSYYGDRCVEYLFGAGAVVPYRWIYVFVNFLGAVWTLDSVWAFADMANGLMAVPNLIALIALSTSVAVMTREYFSREHVPYR